MELRRHRAHQQQHSLFHMVKMDAFFRVRCRVGGSLRDRLPLEGGMLLLRPALAASQ